MGRLKVIISIITAAAITFGAAAFINYPKISRDLDMSKFDPEPVFADEFDSDHLNTDVWTYTSDCRDKTIMRKGAFMNGRMLSVHDGNLHIKTAYCEDGLDGGPAGWYNCCIQSTNKVEYKYGYIECRCIIPLGCGMWGAFWLNSSSMSSGSAAGQGIASCQNGRNGSEIDIFEGYCATSGNYNSVDQNMYTNGYGEDLTSKHFGMTELDSSPYEGYHTYGLEWNPDRLIFYVDGKKTVDYEDSPENEILVTRAFEYILLSVEISGKNGVPGYGWSSPARKTSKVADGYINGDEDWKNYTNDFVVDYVRLYRYKDSSGINCELKRTDNVKNVFFDVNHDDIGVNLFSVPREPVTVNGITYSYDPVTSEITLNGTASVNSGTFADMPFRAEIDQPYTVSVVTTGGTFSTGCLVFEATGGLDRTRNSDIRGTSTFKWAEFNEIEQQSASKLNFRYWFSTSSSQSVTYSNYKLKLKFEAAADKSDFSPNGFRVTFGEAYGTLPAVAREGYTFTGWFTSPGAGTRITADTIADIESDQTLYAHWEEV